jgi:hypothetical protein
MLTAGEQEYIEKAVTKWNKADEECDKNESSRFLIESMKGYIKECSMKEKKNSSSKRGKLKEVEIVENCTLKDGNKSYKIVIYLTDKKTLEEAVNDYLENFNEERVVEVVKNFDGKEVKSEVSSASGTLDND